MWYFIIAMFVVAIIAGILQGNANLKKEKERGEALRVKASQLESFNASTTIVGNKQLFQFLIDNSSRKVCYIDEHSNRIIPFEDIISVELVENGTTIQSKSTMRTIGGTFVGGVLAGGAGAIVGGLSGKSKQEMKVSEITVRMRIRDLNKPILEIKTFDAYNMTTERKPIKESQMEGNLIKQGRTQAQQIVDYVSVIIDDVDKNGDSAPATKSTNNNSSNLSVADELKKLADLKNEGILSQEEFDAQKAKFLSQDSIQSSSEISVTESVVDPYIRHLLNEGRIIEAIKVYRDMTGVSLSDAKSYIDSIR